MRRRCGPGLFLLLMLAGLMPQTAAAQPGMTEPYAASYLPRALCVTDPYGVSFHNWYGSPVAYNSYFSTPSNGSYSSGYNGATTGYYMGGVPAVASATTSEWVVQRTSVFPISPYYLYPPDALYPRSYPPAPLWAPRLGKKSGTNNLRPTVKRGSPSRRPTESNSQNQSEGIQQVSAVATVQREEPPSDIDAGDKLFREGEYTEAYLCYLTAQRDVGRHSEIYFRQAFALVAMQRYSHAVAKLKRAFQIDADALRQTTTLNDVLGVGHDGADSQAKKKDWLERVSNWAKADPRDLERQLLLGVMLHCDRDPRADEFLNAAAKLARRNETPSR